MAIPDTWGRCSECHQWAVMRAQELAAPASAAELRRRVLERAFLYDNADDFVAGVDAVLAAYREAFEALPERRDRGAASPTPVP